MKNILLTICLFILVFVLSAFAQQPKTITIGSETKILKPYSSNAITTDETARCLNCHSTRMPKLVETWETSTHAKNGVGCYECHKAEKGDQTAKQGHFSFNVQLVVSPSRCGSCHQEQYQDFAVSAHADTFDRIKNIPFRKTNPDLFETSCVSCHGTVFNMKKGKSVDNSWPNMGIGRINPDGSRGNCASCHGYHTDSLAVARDTATCGKCHNTDFSPALQTWSMSAHGTAYNKAIKEADLTKKQLNFSEDAVMKPNCQACHIQASNDESKATHNVSSRLSWNLSNLKATHTDDWGTKRLEMQKSCRNCHASTQINQFYRKLDAAVNATNHIVDKKIASDTSFIQIMELNNSLLAIRIGFAMLGTVDPLKIEMVSH